MNVATRALERRLGLRIAAKFVAEFEGGQSADGLFHPYRDAVGVLTEGYGHTSGVGVHSKPWSKARALRVLRRDLAQVYCKAIDDLKLPLKRHMYAAVLSFVYNLGPGAIGPENGIGDALRKHHWKRAANEMLKWDKAGGQRLEGLTRRRQDERALFLKDL